MAVFSTALAPDLERAPEPPGGLLKIQVAGPHSVVWDAAGPGRAQHSVSQKFPGDADVTCRGSLLENHCFKNSKQPLFLLMGTQHAPPLSITRALESNPWSLEEETKAQRC